MPDTKPDDQISVDVDDLRRIEEETEPAGTKNNSPQSDPGTPGGTGGTGGTAHEQDD